MIDWITTLSAVKQTIDITKDLRNVDEKIDSAIWKLRLSEVIDKLVDTKDALIEAKDNERELMAQIKDLKARIANRGKFKDDFGLLYKIDTKGNREGEPFCNSCYVKDEKLYRLLYGPYRLGPYYCNNCKVCFGKLKPTDKVPSLF